MKYIFFLTVLVCQTAFAQEWVTYRDSLIEVSLPGSPSVKDTEIARQGVVKTHGLRIVIARDMYFGKYGPAVTTDEELRKFYAWWADFNSPNLTDLKDSVEQFGDIMMYRAEFHPDMPPYKSCECRMIYGSKQMYTVMVCDSLTDSTNDSTRNTIFKSIKITGLTRADQLVQKAKYKNDNNGMMLLFITLGSILFFVVLFVVLTVQASRPGGVPSPMLLKAFVILRWAIIAVYFSLSAFMIALVIYTYVIMEHSDTGQSQIILIGTGFFLVIGFVALLMKPPSQNKPIV